MHKNAKGIEYKITKHEKENYEEYI